MAIDHENRVSIGQVDILVVVGSICRGRGNRVNCCQVVTLISKSVTNLAENGPVSRAIDVLFIGRLSVGIILVSFCGIVEFCGGQVDAGHVQIKQFAALGSRRDGNPAAGCGDPLVSIDDISLGFIGDFVVSQ